MKQKIESEEKANELVNKYIDIMPILLNQTGKIIFEHAKNCALIAVDEILSSIPKLMGGRAIFPNLDIEYWEDVKTKINKL